MNEQELSRRLDERAIEYEVSIRRRDKDINYIGRKLKTLPWEIAGIVLSIIGIIFAAANFFS